MAECPAKEGWALDASEENLKRGLFFIPLFWGEWGGEGWEEEDNVGTRGNISTLFLSHEPGAAKMSSFQRCLFCNQFSLSLADSSNFCPLRIALGNELEAGQK